MDSKRVSKWVDNGRNVTQAATSLSASRQTRDSNDNVDDDIPMGGSAGDQAKDNPATADDDSDDDDDDDDDFSAPPPPDEEYTKKLGNLDSIADIQQEHFRVGVSRPVYKPKAIGGAKMQAVLAPPISSLGDEDLETFEVLNVVMETATSKHSLYLTLYDS